MGTAKAFHISAIPLLTHPINKPLGVIWLLAAVIFARFHGQIRSGPDARWMSFAGEQVNF
jgi:hypothetical protein